MKTTNLLSLISIALIALSQPAWAGGGGGFHGGGFGGGFRGGGFAAGGFRGGALAAPPVGGGAVSRGGGVGFGSPRFGGVRPAPYTYGGTHFPGASLAAQPVHSDTTTEAPPVCCSDIPIQRTEKPIDGIVCRQERNRYSPADSLGTTNKAKHEDLERAVGGGGPEGDGQSPGVRAP